MTKPKFKPESWHTVIEDSSYIKIIRIVNATGTLIANVFPSKFKPNIINANLIAAAPELYDALMEAKNEMFIMLNEWALGKSEVDYLASYRERKGKNNYEFFNKIQELLKKVRDGE